MNTQPIEQRSIPLLMCGEMVVATLNDLKNQTRRLKGLELVNEHPGDWSIGGLVSDEAGLSGVQFRRGEIRTWVEPPMRVGDRIWVKETFHVTKGAQRWPDGTVLYRADHGIDIGGSYVDCCRWKPSIFMPRKLSRLTLEITAVRCERLQDIGKDGRFAKDVLAEGITRDQINNWAKWLHPDDAPAHTYAVLWESLNGKGSWAKNPFVWVNTFKRIKP